MNHSPVTNFAGETRLLTVGKEALVSVNRAAGLPGRMLVAVTSDGYRTDYPRAGGVGGSIEWENPEWFSKRFKERARSHVLAFDKAETAQEEKDHDKLLGKLSQRQGW